MSDKTDTSGTVSGHVREMSATERLRALLTERGVGWEDMSALGFLATLWHGVDAACTALEGADDIPHGKVSVQACLTPEQAVDATLGVADATGGRQDGAGTCHAVISDNLNESEGAGDAWADCSECGHLLYVLTDPSSEPPNYCPGCGRMIID